MNQHNHQQQQTHQQAQAAAAAAQAAHYRTLQATHNGAQVPNLLPGQAHDSGMMDNARFDGESIGLVVLGLDYSMLKVKQQNGELFISQVICKNADKKGVETESKAVKLGNKSFYLQVKVKDGGICSFSYSLDGKKFQSLGTDFKSREGKWIGAKLGFTALREGKINDAGSVDIDWFRFNK